ncbi:hypothetical protein SAMN04488505_101118 [Chitinophaga rupis]|uniref:Lipoprotein n=1 Tax=Chitinophaga rupis TaxID=573321 RepID=A0A1H7GND3_9BACT|nr:hypothetical protein [Chitinophaga rupis]SEK39601.1 hypothetical protein SAMN04488505_101118 [Chitinophaga rupis]
MKFYHVLCLATIITAASSCGSAETQKAATAAPSPVKLSQFNDVEDVQKRLSAAGIGELRKWKGDGFGYLSSSPYFSFGEGELPDNMAYYLESDNANNIKKLKLVLNINTANKKTALSKFAETVEKTYNVLELPPSSEIVKAAVTGKATEIDKDTYTESIELEKSNIETWKFVIETK